MYKQLTILAFACAFAVGCRDSGTTTTTPGADMSGTTTTGGDMAGTVTTGGDMAALTYSVSTITAMRTAGTYGGFELDNVILLAVNPGGTHMYVQDATGGNLSAIAVQCTGTAHPCTLASTLAKYLPGHSLTLKGLYEKGSAANGNFENFYLSTATDNGAGTAPAPATVMMSDIIKTAGVASRNLWFQKVSFTLTDDLVLFDMSPVEFKFTPTAPKTCPNDFGFGMVPKTGAPASPAACDLTCATGTATTAPPSTCVQPAANTTTNANEILIGTDFYKGFTYSADCACYAGFKDTAVTSTNAVASGKVIQGILISDTVTSGSAKVPYVYLAPTSNTVGTGDFVFTTP